MQKIQSQSVQQKKLKVKVSASLAKLLTQPREYAEGAVKSLESQLQRCISPKKKTLLEGRLNDWRIFLEKYDSSAASVLNSNETTQTINTGEVSDGAN